MNENDPLSPMIKGSFSTITKEVGVEVPSHAQRILRKLSEMRSNANLCDTELCCDGRSVSFKLTRDKVKIQLCDCYFV